MTLPCLVWQFPLPQYQRNFRSERRRFNQDCPGFRQSWLKRRLSKRKLRWYWGRGHCDMTTRQETTLWYDYPARDNMFFALFVWEAATFGIIHFVTWVWLLMSLSFLDLMFLAHLRNPSVSICFAILEWFNLFCVASNCFLLERVNSLTSDLTPCHTQILLILELMHKDLRSYLIAMGDSGWVRLWASVCNGPYCNFTKFRRV